MPSDGYDTSNEQYRVTVRGQFDALGPKVAREAVARHDLLQTHLTEYTEATA